MNSDSPYLSTQRRPRAATTMHNNVKGSNTPNRYEFPHLDYKFCTSLGIFFVNSFVCAWHFLWNWLLLLFFFLLYFLLKVFSFLFRLSETVHQERNGTDWLSEPFLSMNNFPKWISGWKEGIFERWKNIFPNPRNQIVCSFEILSSQSFHWLLPFLLFLEDPPPSLSIHHLEVRGGIASSPSPRTFSIVQEVNL